MLKHVKTIKVSFQLVSPGVDFSLILCTKDITVFWQRGSPSPLQPGSGGPSRIVFFKGYGYGSKKFTC